MDTSSVPQVGQEVCWKKPPPPMPPGAQIVPVADRSCLEIAAHYGVTLRELEEANRNRASADGQNDVNDVMVIDWNDRDANKQPRCTIQPNAEVVVPRPTLMTVAEAVEKYPCTAGEGQKCLSSDASLEEALQYVLYNEGGSTEGSALEADVMQVIINRTDRLLERWGLSKETMSREEYGRWLLHVCSGPLELDTF